MVKNTGKSKNIIRAIGYLFSLIVLFVIILKDVHERWLQMVALVSIGVAFVSIIVMQWVLPFASVYRARHTEASPPVEEISTFTGALCVQGGKYYCCRHTECSIEMVGGRRFPVCESGNSVHVTSWILT